MRVQGFAYRGPQEPQNEVMQRGAKDGFTESNQLNMAMVRRRMKNPALKFEALQVGTRSHTPVALAYLEGVASPAIVKQVRQRLQNCPLKTVLGAGYLTAFLERGGVLWGGPERAPRRGVRQAGGGPSGRFGRGHPLACCWCPFCLWRTSKPWMTTWRGPSTARSSAG